MKLLRRIEKLESLQISGESAVACEAIEAMKREIAEMSDEELDAAIAGAEPCDPETQAKFSRLDDDELYHLGWEMELAEKGTPIEQLPHLRKFLAKGENRKSSWKN